MREQKEKKGSIMSKKDEVFREMDQNLLKLKWVEMSLNTCV